MRIAQCLGVVEINEISRLKSLHGPSDIPAPLNVIFNLFILICFSAFLFDIIHTVFRVFLQYCIDPVWLYIAFHIGIAFNIGIDVSILVLMFQYWY